MRLENEPVRLREVGYAEGRLLFRQAEGEFSDEPIRPALEQTYYRWRKEYGGLRLDQAKRLKELEKENVRLKKLVADQALDNAILKEVSSGKF